MSENTVNIGRLKASGNEMDQIWKSLKEVQRQLENTADSDAMAGQASLATIAEYLKQFSCDVEKSTVSLKNVQTALQEIAGMYEETERRILGQNLSGISTSGGSPASEEPSFWQRIQQGIKDLEKAVSDYLKGARYKFCMFAGDPVNMSSGNYFLQTRDLVVKGFTPIIWERSYNVQEKNSFVLGKGWRHSHLWEIAQTDGNWCLTEPDGSTLFFEETGNGEYEALSGEPCRLLMKEERIEVIRNRETLLFDMDGRIQEHKHLSCGRISYRYEQGRLMTLVGECGTFLRLFYNRVGLLTDVVSSDGGAIHYEYDGLHLMRVKSVGVCTEYGYDVDGCLDIIRGADGKTQLHNIYDEQSRVKEQQLIDGGVLTYEYLKDRTVLAWPDGTSVTYVFDSAYRHIRTIYHDSEESCTYNSRNQKTSFTDRLGRTTKYGYDTRGNLIFVINPSGNRTSITYNSRDQVIAVKRPDGGRRIWHYTEDGLVSEKTDAQGGITKYSYNDKGLPVGVCFPDGTQMDMVYDERGNIISCDADGIRIVSAEYDDANRRILERNGNGDTWLYTYDDAGRIVCVTNPKGDQKRYEYDEFGRVRKLTDYAGNVSTCVYNDAGDLLCKTDVCGNMASFEYDERRRLKERHLPGGCIFSYAYDCNNRLYRVLRDGAMYREFEYDLVGNLLCERDALGAEVRYSYDVCDRVVQISRADGAVKTFTYDSCGRIIRETDYQGGVTLYEYDFEGHMIARTDPIGGRTEWHYTASGLVERIAESTGRETRYEYGSCGRVTREEAVGGGFVEYAYDACGRLVGECFADGHQQAYTYDSCGNLTGIRDGVGRCHSARYDALGRITQVTDPNGNSTSYTYRPDGILTGIFDAAGSSASYQYSPQGYLEKIVRKGRSFNMDSGKMEEQEHVTLYERDHLGRLLSETDSLGHKISYTYDVLDRVISRTDRMGRETTVEYDSSGNMCGLTFADGGFIRLDHSRERQLIGMEDVNGRMRIARDAVGRPIQMTGSDEMRIAYSYTKQGRIASIQYPDNTSVQYQYDEYGRPMQMCCGSLALSFMYDEMGRLASRTDEEGSGTAWEYEPAGKIAKISYVKNGEPWKTCSYSYDACGNKREVNWDYLREPDRNIHTSYAYDVLNRISEVYEEGICVRSYSYDGFGNRIRLEEKGTVTQYQYNEANQLVLSLRKEVGDEEWSRTEYQYDLEGNQICVSGPDGVRETRYNSLNHPVATDTGTKSVRRQYNGLGYLLATAQWNRRTAVANELLETDVSGREVEDVFSVDGEMLAAADVSRMHYLNDFGVFGDSTKLLVLGQSENSLIKYLQDPFGMRVAWMDADGSSRLLWTDEMGTINAMAGRDGFIYESDYYDEFGNLQEIRIDECGKTRHESCFNSKEMGMLKECLTEKKDIPRGFLPREKGLPRVLFLGFAGLLCDSEEGMYTAGVRQYNPLHGRFTEEDPMMRETYEVQNQNLYTYCFNQPMTLVDRGGCFPSLSEMYQGLQNFNNGVKETWNNGISVVKNIWDSGVSMAKDTWNKGVTVIKDTWDSGVQHVQHVTEQAGILYRLYTDPEFHYSRNQYNETPTDVTEVFGYDESGQLIGKNGWEPLPEQMNKYHTNTNGSQGNQAAFNQKFIKKNPDGSSSEAIICIPPNKEWKPYLVDDYLNGGTFNFYNPTSLLDGYIPHFLFDMGPYYLYGNQREDGGLRKKVKDGLDWVREHLASGMNLQVMCTR